MTRRSRGGGGVGFLRRCALVSWLGALAAGCAHVGLSCPRQAGPEWREYESPHFAVTTDLRPSRARALVRDFERTYRSFLDVTGWHFPGRGEPPGRMRVVVFARRGEYEAVAPPNTDGFYRPESLVAEAAVVIDGSQPTGEVFLHELTHRLIRYYAPNTPLGLNEGLAEYFSTFVVERGVARTGYPPRLVIDRGRATLALPDLRSLLTIESFQGLSPGAMASVYIGGWFLVHTMARFHPQQLGEMLARMADGESFGTAFLASFGADAWTTLAERYVQVINRAYRYSDRLMMPTWRKPYTAPEVVAGVEHERTLGDAALHLLWADLQLGRHDIAAQVALAAAHGGDSAQLAYMRGLLHLGRNEIAAAERDFANAVDARPDQERYHLTLARVHGLSLGVDPSRALAAMAPDMEWLAAHAKTPDSLALVAVYEASRGSAELARTHADRALAIDPTNANAYLALATIDASRGDLDGAIEAARRSLHLTPEGAGNQAAKELLDKLRRLRPPRSGP